MAEWRQLLGDEFDIVRQLLRPTIHRVDFYPCPTPGGDGCPRRVVDLGEKGLLAVCGDTQKNCRNIELTAADLVVYELDRRRLGLLAVMAMGATPITFSPVTELRETFRVGEYHPLEGERFPILMCFPSAHEQLRHIIFMLLRMESVPFILLIPDDSFMVADLRQMTSERKSRVVLLADLLISDSPGKELLPSPTAATCLTAFHADVMPDSSARSRFPTPPGTRWNQIKIRFLNRDTVSIQCQGMVRTVTYHDMNMNDGRSGQPNRQWMLLYEMADTHGQMEFHNHRIDQKKRKNKENLTKSLRSYFGIQDDSIIWEEDASAYRTLFMLESDG